MWSPGPLLTQRPTYRQRLEDDSRGDCVFGIVPTLGTLHTNAVHSALAGPPGATFAQCDPARPSWPYAHWQAPGQLERATSDSESTWQGSSSTGLGRRRGGRAAAAAPFRAAGRLTLGRAWLRFGGRRGAAGGMHLPRQPLLGSRAQPGGPARARRGSSPTRASRRSGARRVRARAPSRRGNCQRLAWPPRTFAPGPP